MQHSNSRIATRANFANSNENEALLVALASMHYLYRRFHEGLKIIEVADHAFPQTRSILELKIVLLAEMGQRDALLDTIAVLEGVAKPLASEIATIKAYAMRR